MSTDSSDGVKLEHLSASARHVLKLADADAYSAIVPTTTGSPAARDALELIKPADLTATPAFDRLAAAAALSGLWLWHDFVADAHTICQTIDTPEGSLWHAIVHRQEGDFYNAKYWFRRCVDHPIYRSIAAKVDEITQIMPVDKQLFRLTANGWSPDSFVDLVNAVHEKPDDSRRRVTVAIQRIEWQAAFEYCVRQAAGR